MKPPEEGVPVSLFAPLVGKVHLYEGAVPPGVVNDLGFGGGPHRRRGLDPDVKPVLMVFWAKLWSFPKLNQPASVTWNVSLEDLFWKWNLTSRIYCCYLDLGTRRCSFHAEATRVDRWGDRTWCRVTSVDLQIISQDAVVCFPVVWFIDGRSGFLLETCTVLLRMWLCTCWLCFYLIFYKTR